MKRNKNYLDYNGLRSDLFTVEKQRYKSKGNPVKVTMFDKQDKFYFLRNTFLR